jgi:hypothetical protein
MSDSETTKRVDVPQFEMVSCPSINLRELREANTPEKRANVRIVDRVTGESTTVGLVFEKFVSALEHALKPKWWQFVKRFKAHRATRLYRRTTIVTKEQ